MDRQPTELYSDSFNFYDMRDYDSRDIENRYGSLFKRGIYPVQIEPWVQGYAAELRGTYVNKWRPRASRFGMVRDGGGKLHNGVDLFAPRGTEVVAVVSGELELVPDEGEAIGNRAWLWFDWGGERWRFVYGHLDGFRGAARSVSAGDLIGYAGCTGNAANEGTCGRPNECGLISDHVHLILIGPSGSFADPVGALRWSVRYQEDGRDVACRDLGMQTSSVS